MTFSFHLTSLWERSGSTTLPAAPLPRDGIALELVRQGATHRVTRQNDAVPPGRSWRRFGGAGVRKGLPEGRERQQMFGSKAHVWSVAEGFCIP